MKKHILLLAFGLVLSCSGLQAQDWLAFQADNCLCKTKFPTRPELKQEQNGGYKSHQALAEFEGSVFLFDYGILDSPTRKEDSYMIASESVKGFSESLKATTIKQKKWKVKGWEGIKTKMEVPDKGLTVYYNTVIVRSIHYQIGTISEGDNHKKVIKKFLKSFKVI